MRKGEVEGRQTVDGALELLAAYFAGQVADAAFLVDFDGHGALVVAEETWKDFREGFVLDGWSVNQSRLWRKLEAERYFFLALRLLRGLLSFTLDRWVRMIFAGEFKIVLTIVFGVG